MTQRCPPVVLLSATLALAATTTPAQVIEGRPVIRELRIAPGARIDLDTGVVLPRDVEHPFASDLHFDRDGIWFFLTPKVGAIAGVPEDEQARGDAWTTERQRLPLPRRTQDPIVWFVKTDRGAVARVSLAVVDAYSTASAVLTWALAPGSHPVFAPGPEGLTTTWKGRRKIEVSWRGDADEYLVEFTRAGNSRILTTKKPPVTLTLAADVAPDELHHIGVRRLLPDGVVSLATTLTVPSTRKPSKRGTVDFADRWYDTNGGLSVRTGEQEELDPDVVFYLYGIYAPGGGVQKVGQGRKVYEDLVEIPETGYLPVYGRLDEGDVLAIRLRDGRFAKLLQVAIDQRDNRSGMRVHFAYLEGGGRRLLARPGQGSFKKLQVGLALQWAAVPDAVKYRVLREGEDGRGTVQRSTKLRIPKAERGRFHRYSVHAIDAIGNESDPLVIEAHTFSDEHRIGSIVLDTSGAKGFSFSAKRMVKHTSGAAHDPDLELLITGSAGGASYLSFDTPHGAASTRGQPFGAFPADPEAVKFAKTFQSDDRNEHSSVFWVKTRDGGIASVRIANRDHPRSTLEYVWRPGER